MLLTRHSLGSARLVGCALVLLAHGPAFAQRSTSQDALLRFEETLSLRSEDGSFSREQLAPVIVVSTAPAFEETRAWFPTAALSSLIRVFGAAAVRACEACMVPRLYIDGPRLEQNVGSLTVADIVRLDDAARGAAAPARTAVWLEETPQGVSFRMVGLSNSRILHAQNFDPKLRELARTQGNTSQTRELERRIRGDSLSHVFLDAAVYPGQHFSVDFAEQWGSDNANISGITLSAFDPILGVGGCYYRVIPQALNLSLGAQLLVSLPSALVSQVSDGQVGGFFDPLVTGVLVARLPIASSNYAVLLTASTNGRIGLGISLLNFTLLPVLP